jgi:4-diphosphocytidyl-2-C-methyl-D-erythritol kinase
MSQELVPPVSASITLNSFAKVNYTLDILSPRSDGYHNVATVMQTISLADFITVETAQSTGISLECDAPDVPTDRSNLAYRAAELALQAVGRKDGLRIRLEKRVPSQAGLGGGSANAAYALLGVNRLLSLGLDHARLTELAAELGSDVAFFLTGGTAAARGRGESITPLDDGPGLWFVVVKPEINVSTGWAYGALDAVPDRQSARATRRMEEALRTGEAERVYSRMTNDYEQVLFAEHLPLALLHDELLMARCRTARLCGSGSALFGVCLSEAEANEAARIMRLKYENVHVCRTVGREEAIGVGC